MKTILAVGILLIIVSTPACKSGTSAATESPSLENVAAPITTPSTELTRPTDLNVEQLCKNIGKIKRLPGKDPKEEVDTIYKELLAAGRSALPCLVEQISNEDLTKDPRQAPTWAGYKVGDTAVFVIVRIIGDENLLKEMLPEPNREEWKINGVYAYFNYVSESENRRQLQSWWKEKIKSL